MNFTKRLWFQEFQPCYQPTYGFSISSVKLKSLYTGNSSQTLIWYYVFCTCCHGQSETASTKDNSTDHLPNCTKGIDVNALINQETVKMNEHIHHLLCSKNKKITPEEAYIFPTTFVVQPLQGLHRIQQETA